MFISIVRASFSDVLYIRELKVYIYFKSYPKFRHATSCEFSVYSRILGRNTAFGHVPF